MLATVNAFFLKHLLFVQKMKLYKISQQNQTELVVAAITDILMNASDGGNVLLVLPNQQVKAKVPCQPN